MTAEDRGGRGHGKGGGGLSPAMEGRWDGWRGRGIPLQMLWLRSPW